MWRSELEKVIFFFFWFLEIIYYLFIQIDVKHMAFDAILQTTETIMRHHAESRWLVCGWLPGWLPGCLAGWLTPVKDTFCVSEKSSDHIGILCDDWRLLLFDFSRICFLLFWAVHTIAVKTRKYSQPKPIDVIFPLPCAALFECFAARCRVVECITEWFEISFEFQFIQG